MTRLAIIGCGRVVEAFHLPALERSRVFEVACLVDRDRPRAAALAKRYSIPLALEDAGLALDHCDAVLIATSNKDHEPLARFFLKNKRHVLVEKPMATTAGACLAMMDESRRSGAVLKAAMVRRYSPGHRHLKALIDGGTFGRLLSVEVREGVKYNWPAATGFFLNKAESGGGALIDFGAHVLDALWWWLGELSMESYEDDAFGGVEAECRVRLKSGSGVPVTIELSRLRLLTRTRFCFEKADVETDLRGSRLNLFARAAEGQALFGKVEDLVLGDPAPERDPFELQWASFADDIQKGAGITPEAKTAKAVAEIFEKCYAMRRPLRGPASPAFAAVQREG